MKHTLVAVALAASLAFIPTKAAFASDTSARAYGRQDALSTRQVQSGVVLSIRPVTIENRSRVNSGSVIGGSLGYAAARQVDNRDLRSAARVAGTAIGGVVGTKAQNAMTKRHGVEIVVHTVGPRGESVVAIVQDDDQPIAVGDRVLLIVSNRDMRVAQIGN